jgi:hypothetical protein
MHTFDLQIAGYIPVQHIQNVICFTKQLDIKLQRAGCLFQLNLLAVVG